MEEATHHKSAFARFPEEACPYIIIKLKAPEATIYKIPWVWWGVTTCKICGINYKPQVRIRPNEMMGRDKGQFNALDILDKEKM